MLVAELKDGTHVNGQFIVANESKCLNNSGVPYLTMELKDSSGSITAKKWDVMNGDEEIFVNGNIVHIEGDVVKYRDSLQLKITSGKIVPLEEVNVQNFMQAPPVPQEILLQSFKKYVDGIVNGDCKSILQYFLDKYEDKFIIYPAGVSVHHEYRSGLLMHVVTMLDIASYLLHLYEPINKDLLFTGIILHDLGKINELEGPIAYHYTVEGRLLGHISIMVGEIRECAHKLDIRSEIPLLLEHMVLSHHGVPEHGSPVLPLTKEAMLLSLIDNLDSKMVITSKALADTPKGEFTLKVFPLDGRCLYNPK